MAKMNFTRSNVNERTLSISAPLRSSFDLSESDNITLPMGRLIPVHTQRFMPSSIVKGKFNLNLQMEKIAAPTLGRLRLDTHAFIVYDNRVNRDIKKFIDQDLAGTTTLPSFKYWETMGLLLSNILDANPSGSLRDTIWGYGTAGAQEPSWNTAISDLYQAAVTHYTSLGTDSTDEHMYLKDFYLLEANRLAELRKSFDDYYTAHSELQYSLTRAIYEIMRPYNGAGSLLEMLGYPKWSLFSSEFAFLETGDWKMNTGSSSDATPWQFSATYDYLFTSNYDGNTGYITEQVVCEMLLRKVYSVWYDYFRDYQIEKRTEILDPDSWGSASLLDGLQELDLASMLLIPKYRYYGRDMLTTTQVDDIWRHVYAPIFGDADSTGAVVSNSSGGSELLQNALNLISLSDNQFDVFFPAGVLGGIAEFDVLKHDLQVQRRAGMLEKYLARKFFNADTYTGVLEAHYGVKPEDYQLSTAQYLGGSESMINGEQSVATMDTGFTGADGEFTGTPRGTRTLNAGGTNGCEFSYRVGGNFADIITFASLMPMVKYDAANMHLKEIHFTDMPLPEFAQDSRVEIRSSDYLRGFDYDQKTLGFVPRYMAYRGSLDKVHGDYLEGKRSYQFFRDWFNITNNIGETLQPSGDYFHTFGLNPYSLRVHLQPEAFLGLKEWSHICYGDADMQLFVDCPLPAAVDFI